MSTDIYASLSGASAAWTNMEIVSNNLANVSTTGFKASRLAFESTSPARDKWAQAYATTSGERPDLRDGAVVSDGNPTHLALQGSGYFMVQDGDRPLFTRDGRFQIDAARRLVDTAGRPVLGAAGVIEIPEGETVRIDELGRIFGSLTGELDQVRIGDAEVRAMGNNLFEPLGPTYAGSARVFQGGLEASNVDPLSAMVDLVQASRYFEAFQKAMQASDELDSRLNQTGGG